MAAIELVMRDTVREELITWSLRLGFALVGFISVYVLAFGN
jgi:hypothetical protein